MTGAETDLDLGHYERFKVQRLMPAGVIEAIGDQTTHTLAAHIGEVHRRAGWVLGVTR
jgi:CTP synthase (UTP-ammonia lyase)